MNYWTENDPDYGTIVDNNDGERVMLVGYGSTVTDDAPVGAEVDFFGALTVKGEDHRWRSVSTGVVADTPEFHDFFEREYQKQA